MKFSCSNPNRPQQNWQKKGEKDFFFSCLRSIQGFTCHEKVNAAAAVTYLNVTTGRKNFGNFFSWHWQFGYWFGCLRTRMMPSSKRTMLFMLGLLFPLAMAMAPSQIRLDPDGGYTGIVIKIDKDVPEELCSQILSNIQVRV